MTSGREGERPAQFAPDAVEGGLRDPVVGRTAAVGGVVGVAALVHEDDFEGVSEDRHSRSTGRAYCPASS